ncbi:hypothetical protein CTAM01_08254 [Colletotrichum tamarilloi]|uniref:Uncharacterized protein n=1 Tax=Colletotrichum tamarilloi TaxID=1209934 RepID=A0ABQ9R6W3_9PEZI|nr:uncharacterized protein CTAM01_08254 [Colletotrichum tamarilloi]KAK1496616.1 hypothetical protein CTAM01_08254 [Colletotrichum tamarilloi]
MRITSRIHTFSRSIIFLGSSYIVSKPVMSQREIPTHLITLNGDDESIDGPLCLRTSLPEISTLQSLPPYYETGMEAGHTMFTTHWGQLMHNMYMIRAPRRRSVVSSFPILMSWSNSELRRPK